MGTPLTAPTPEYRETLRHALERTVLDGLRLIATGLALCFVAFLVFNLLDLPREVIVPVAAHDVTLVLAFLALRVSSSAGWIPGRWANCWVAITAWLVSSNILLVAGLLQSSFYTVHIGVVIVGAGSFLLSHRWMIATVLSILMAWALVMISFVPRAQLLHQVFVLLAFCTISFSLHLLRMRSFLRLQGLREFTAALMVTRSPAEVATCLAKNTAVLMGTPHVAAWLVGLKPGWLLRQGEFAQLKGLDDQEGRIEPAAGHAVAGGSVAVWDVHEDHHPMLPLLRRNSSVRQVMVLPLCRDEMLVGLVFLAKSGRARFAGADRNLAETCASQAHVAVESAMLLKEIRRLAMVDDLTGLFNRRQFFFLGQREIARARRQDRAVSVLMIDVDHFKAVNDTHGHAVGDAVLKEIGSRLAGTVRRTDVLGRYGGEEFALLLPDTGMDDARELAERLRKTVEEAEINAIGTLLTVSVSIGLACSEGATEAEEPDLEGLLEGADKALYRAKEKGRNRVEG